MPLYDYECSHCDSIVSALRPMARRHDTSTCPDCETGTLSLKITAPRSLQFKDGPRRAMTPQQALAGTNVRGPGTRSGVRNSVLHNCAGASCAVCAA